MKLAAAALATGALRLAQVKRTKPPQAKQGGLTGLLRGNSHDSGGIIIEAEGDEYITNKKRVRELGTGFFDFINFAPLEKVEHFLAGVKLPPIISSTPPTPVYAMGGSVTSYTKNHSETALFDSLKNEIVNAVKDLNQTLVNKEMTITNHISANEIVKKADPTLIHKANNKGEMRLSAI